MAGGYNLGSSLYIFIDIGFSQLRRESMALDLCLHRYSCYDRPGERPSYKTIGVQGKALL
jgi:hypothetical protein